MGWSPGGRGQTGTRGLQENGRCWMMLADTEELERHRPSATSHSPKGTPAQKGKGKGKSKDHAGSELCFRWASGRGHCADVAPGGECKGPVKRGFSFRHCTETLTVGEDDSSSLLPLGWKRTRGTWKRGLKASSRVSSIIEFQFGAFP